MYTKTYKPRDVIKALNAYDKFKSFRKAANECNISKSTIQRWSVSLKHVFKRKGLSKKQRRRTSKYTNLSQNLTALFSSDTLQFATIRDIQTALHQYYSEKLPSISRIHRCLKKVGISRRRFTSTKVCNINSQRLADLYQSFFYKMSNLRDEEIVCVDETGFCNYNNQHYGYFKKGKVPLESRVSKRERLSLIAAIHPTEGLFHYSKQQRPFDTDTFYTFLSSLIPRLPQGVKAIIMDNVAFHRSKKVTQLLESHNIVALFIPPYSPRCNPIEEVFSFMKRFYRTLYPLKYSLNTNVDLTLQRVTLYKDNVVKHYKHSRKHVTEKCQRQEL